MKFLLYINGPPPVVPEIAVLRAHPVRALVSGRRSAARKLVREAAAAVGRGGSLAPFQYYFAQRKDRSLELTSASHVYDKPGRCVVAVKVIDIFGNDTMSLTPVTVG